MPGAPDLVQAAFFRGLLHYADGDLEGAAAQWREAATLCPGEVRLRAYVAWAEWRLSVEDPAAPGSLPTPDAEGRSHDDWLDAETADLGEAPPPVEPPPWDSERDAGGDSWQRQVLVTWSPVPKVPAVSAQIAPPPSDVGVEAPVRRFLSRTPTHPNLPPLDDVPTISEDQVALLATLSGRLPRRSSAAMPATERGARMALARPPTPAQRTDSYASDTEPSLEVSTPLHEAAAPPGDPSCDQPQADEPDLLDDARRAVARGDIDGAIADIEHAIAAQGGPSSLSLAPHADWMQSVYEERLGDRRRLVRVSAAGPLPVDLDPRAVFVLSRVDGSFSIEELLDISGLDRPTATRYLALLLRRGLLVAG